MLWGSQKGSVTLYYAMDLKSLAFLSNCLMSPSKSLRNSDPKISRPSPQCSKLRISIDSYKPEKSSGLPISVPHALL